MGHVGGCKVLHTICADCAKHAKQEQQQYAAVEVDEPANKFSEQEQLLETPQHKGYAELEVVPDTEAKLTRGAGWEKAFSASQNAIPDTPTPLSADGQSITQSTAQEPSRHPTGGNTEPTFPSAVAASSVSAQPFHASHKAPSRTELLLNEALGLSTKGADVADAAKSQQRQAQTQAQPEQGFEAGLRLPSVHVSSGGL